VRGQEFREWLEGQNYGPKTVEAQIARVQRLEKAYGSLDEIDADGLVRLRETLAYTTEDERAGKPNPAAFEIKGSLYKGLASYRATINYYLRFIGQGGADDNPLTDAAIVALFDRSALFRNGRAGWTAEQTLAFCTIARAVHDAGLDWWLVDVTRGPVRFGRKSAGRKHAEGVMGYVSVAPGWVSFNERGLAGLELDGFVIGPDGADLLAEALVEKADLIDAWKPPQPPRAGLWPDESGSEETDEQDSPTMQGPTNLILYGPPGTGKTYHTAREAVRLCDGYDDYAENEAGRQALAAKAEEEA
jgi:5-methylcytosine-specific restriction protein B